VVIYVGILGERELRYIREKFEAGLVEDVPITYFVSQDCKYCDSVAQLLEDIKSVSGGRITLNRRNLEGPYVRLLGVRRGPVILIGKYAELRYTGSPFGEEAWAFLEGIMLASNRKHGLERYEQDLSSLDKRVKIETIVTPSCPWCPHAVMIAHRVAVASRGKVISDVIEAYEFPEIADKYNVSAVPTVVLSVDGNYTGDVFMVGVPKIAPLVNRILKLGIED